MDLQYSTTTHNTQDLTWLGTTGQLGETHTATLDIASCVAAVHYPDGKIKPGTIVAQYTGGAKSGLWAPYYQDWSDVTNTGLDTAGGIVVDGFEIRTEDGTELATKTAGAILLAGTPQQVFVSKLPDLVLEDETTSYDPVAADLPSAFVNIDGI